MRAGERVGDNLNRALHTVLDKDPRVCLIGEDILDPYGGAFKMTRGLSTNHPDSVITTPISEGGIVGLAAGLALCGERPIVEIMFGDFVTLGFDQILNFATKSVSMYGHRVPIHLVVRCPVGGNRGYGPTHSQSLHKHLLGIPHLALFELSPFHDNVTLIDRLVSRGEPCVLFENKTLYAGNMYAGGVVDDLFLFDYVGPAGEFARVFAERPDDFDAVIIAPGGLTGRALAAARDLLIELELKCQIIVPSQLHPIDLDPLLATLERAERICLVEESVPGGTWASEIARQIYDRLWGSLKNRILVVHSRNSVIPSAAHLEREVLVQAATIYRAMRESASA
ncbi:MAG: alpha-ketoacid dehydrogenase subunit beta [Micromonosporaceae bacterium]